MLARPAKQYIHNLYHLIPVGLMGKRCFVEWICLNSSAALLTVSFCAAALSLALAAMAPKSKRGGKRDRGALEGDFNFSRRLKSS